jgi:hypothetical protein
MRWHYRIIISCDILAFLISMLLGPLKSLNNPTPLTKNIAPSADIYVIERNLSPSKHAYVGFADKQILEVGYDAAHKTPITSYIRFDLISIEKPEWWNFWTSVSYTAELKMLGVSAFPQNSSNINTNYIITAARIDCKNPWKEFEWNPYNCPPYTTDATTEI